MSYLYVWTATVFHDPFSLSLLVAVEYLSYVHVVIYGITWRPA